MEIQDKDIEKHYPIRKNLTNPGQKFQKTPGISKIKNPLRPKSEGIVSNSINRLEVWIESLPL